MAKIETAIETMFEKMMEDLHVPGAAVAIVKDGKVILSQGFGYKNLEKKEHVTPQTLFAIGSSSKAFGTFSLSLLAQQKKFDWDAPVQDYVPTFSLSDKVTATQITARDLAAHRTGISRHDMIWYNSALSRKGLVDKLKYLPLDAPLRTTFLYNNLMYATMSQMVENITNQTWEQYVTDHMLAPLRMNNTNFSVIDSKRADNAALPYMEKDGEIIEIPFRNIDTVGAAGCINSTVEDMAKWVLLHLNQGKVDDHQLLDPELLQQMYIPHNQVPDQPPFSIPESPVNSYGLGWFISSYRGYKMIHHGGNIDGFSAFASFIPNENIGIVILTNAGNSVFPLYMAHHMYDELLGLSPIDWHKRAIEDSGKLKEMMNELNGLLPEQVKDTNLSHPVQDYTGTFEHPAYGTLEVYEKNNELYFKFLDVETPLVHYHYDVFSASFSWMHIDMKMLFAYQMNAAGTLHEIQVHSVVLFNDKPFTFTRMNNE